MSLKVNTFANIITNPMNVHNFVVSIPDVMNGSVVVSSTTFPTEKLREIILHYQGEEIVYPTIPKIDHSWKVKVPEADNGIIKREFDALKHNKYNQKTGVFVPTKWKDVIVTARDLAGNEVFKVILHGVWLVGRENVDLNNSDPTKNWEWDYEFRYQWIEDQDVNNKGSENPLS